MRSSRAQHARRGRAPETSRSRYATDEASRYSRSERKAASRSSRTSFDKRRSSLPGKPNNGRSRLITIVILVLIIIFIGTGIRHCTTHIGSIAENSYDWSLLETNGDIKSYTSPSGERAKLGVDVSEHNGPNLDWDQMAQSGVEFAYIRCGYRGYTEGKVHADEYVDQNILGAKKADIDVSVYIFSQAITLEEAYEEADFACDYMDEYHLGKSLPVAFDMEENNVSEERIDGLSNEELTDIALAFCMQVRKRGYTPIVYGNDRWLNGYFDLSKLAGKELIWLAEYGDQPSASYAFKIWQYRSDGNLPGSGGGLDMDLMFPDK